MFIEIAMSLPLDRTFHYEVPASLPCDETFIGRRVLAPFGKKTLVGYIVGIQHEAPPFPVKPIQSILDHELLIDQPLLDLARWVASRYLCSLGEALACIVPPTLAKPKRQGAAERQKRTEDEEKILKGNSFSLSPDPSPLKLTPGQSAALTPLLAAVGARQFKPFLIRGITDSGKTELYLRAMDLTLEQGRQALFLLPEIALTPPFFDRLRERYGEQKVGLWHSGLSEGERYRTWTGARRGEIQVILGARSAVFAPFPKLGLLVLDEEHEATYKQEDRPRYHTREVALRRAELSSSVLIMGSATPSIESYWKAKEGLYTLLELTSRVEEKQLPPVELIDRRAKGDGQKAKENGKEQEQKGDLQAARRSSPTSRFPPFSVFSEPLRLAIEQRLARKEQILLFVNRRGYTPFLRCSTCGWVARCDRCAMTLTLHHSESSPYMQCHTCSRKQNVPIQCPSCQSMRVRQYGTGTQKVEEELKTLFPFVKLGRLDRDVAAKRKQHENIYRAFASRELDVLVGTQMIAKGFNFPGVTLVGVVDADVSLHLPDFRAAERTFDLLTQVAGRTGRGKSRGLVYVQTHHPDHYALQAAKHHDYLRFYGREIEDRKSLSYPPYCQLVSVILRASKEEAAHAASEELYARLESVHSEATLLGPSPAPYSRLRNQFRYQILLKGAEASLARLLEVLRAWKPSKAYMSVDVDPADLL